MYTGLPNLGLLGMLGGSSLQQRAIAALSAAAGSEAWYVLDHRGVPWQFQDPTGTTAAVVTQPVGLALDTSRGGAVGADVKGTGVVGLVGTATAATYNTATGAGSSTRVDASNRSFITLTATASLMHRFRIAVAGASLEIRQGNHNGATLATLVAGFDGVVHLTPGVVNFTVVAPTNATTATFTITECVPVPGTHVTAIGNTRPTLLNNPGGASFDGSDDAFIGASGGGGTTGFFYCCAFRPAAIGASMMLMNDVGATTGYYSNITATGNARLGAGNGVGFLTTTTADTLSAGVMSILTFWDDGVNLNAQIGLGPVASATRPVVAAGSAAFEIGKRAGVPSAYAAGLMPCQTYIRNGNPDAATRLLAQQLMAQWAGVSL